MKILNRFRKWLFVLMLGVASTAQAVVISVTDGFVGVYDPSNTYVPTGEIGPDFFSFKFLFTDPSHSFEVTIQAPDDLSGSLQYAVTSGLDFAGLNYFGDSLIAGESVTFEMGNIAGTSPTIQVGQSLTLRALGVTTPYVIGTSDDPIITGNIGDASNGGIPAVPEPSTVLMFAAALVVIAGAARRRLVA